jgi:hypothetical protein
VANSDGEDGEELSEHARNAEMMEDVLKFFAGGENEERAGRFDEMRQAGATDKLAEDLRKLEELRKDGQDDSPEAEALRKNIAERLSNLAGEFKREHEKMLRSQLEKLAQAHAQTQELLKKAEEQRQATARARREFPQPGRPPFDLPPGGPSQARNPGSITPGGGGSGTGPGAATTQNQLNALSETLTDINDTGLSRIAQMLHDSVPGFDATAPLAQAEQRLTELISDLLGKDSAAVADRKVPPEYQRTVEDYFRALSDDTGE